MKSMILSLVVLNHCLKRVDVSKESGVFMLLTAACYAIHENDYELLIEVIIKIYNYYTKWSLSPS